MDMRFLLFPKNILTFQTQDCVLGTCQSSILGGTVNKQFMKDYRAALVTARVNFFPICAFLSLHVEYSETWPKIG